MDAYLRQQDARVVAVNNELHAVTLDQTIFYPGGGGQPPGTGRLRQAGTGREWAVASSEKDGAVVWHLLAGDDELPPVGIAVRATIDWDNRFRLMRTHTALHVLCGVVFRDYGALVTGGNMGTERARMDFEMESADFTPDRVATIERRANQEIAVDREVQVTILPREEAFEIPDLIRTMINLLPPGIAEIRTVEIVGLDLQADGGTHVASTREAGGLRVVGTRSKCQANKRLEIELTDGPVL